MATNRGAGHWHHVEPFQPRSPGELRQMAETSDDPVIREALAVLADYIEEEERDAREGEDNPWSAKH